MAGICAELPMSEARTPPARFNRLHRPLCADHGISAGAGALPQLTVVANERPKDAGAGNVAVQLRQGACRQRMPPAPGPSLLWVADLRSTALVQLD